MLNRKRTIPLEWSLFSLFSIFFSQIPLRYWSYIWIKGNRLILDIQAAIQKQGYNALKTLYQELKPGFLHYMLRYTPDPNMRLDAYHEAMIAFYEYCMKGKYQSEKSSPKTMVFLMGRAYLINRIKREQRSVLHKDEMVDAHIEEQIVQQYEFALDDSEVLIKNALLKIGEKCRELLQLFFYHHFSIQDIMEKMSYKNENVVSSHKSRCIKQMKEILKEKG